MILRLTSVVVSAVFTFIDDFRRLLPARLTALVCSAGFLISISRFGNWSCLPELISLRFQNSLSIQQAFRVTVFDQTSSLCSHHRFSQEAVLRSRHFYTLRRHLQQNSNRHQDFQKACLWQNCLPKKCYIERRFCLWENSIWAGCPVPYRFYRNVTEDSFRRKAFC